jgi:hypothetical protein
MRILGPVWALTHPDKPIALEAAPALSNRRRAFCAEESVRAAFVM